MSERLDILLATHNGAGYLDELIESLRAQTYADWRLLVSDDASEDNTLDIIRRYAGIDSRISLLPCWEGCGSAKGNFFRLLQYCDADYVAFCDQDDVWHPEKLQLCMERMGWEERSQQNCPILVFSDLRVVDRDLQVIGDSFLAYSGLKSSRVALNNLLVQNVAPGCSMIANRHLVDAMKMVQDASDVYMHDWWAMLIASAFGRISHIEAPLIDYRQHMGNTVGASSYSMALISYWLQRVDEMIAYFEALQRQAAFFARTYDGRLSAKQKSMLADFGTLGSQNRLARIMRLSRHHLWKNKPALVAGELLCAFRQSRAAH